MYSNVYMCIIIPNNVAGMACPWTQTVLLTTYNGNPTLNYQNVNTLNIAEVCVFRIQQSLKVTVTDRSNLWGCWGPRRSLWPRLVESWSKPEEVHTKQPRDERLSLECSGLLLGRRTGDFPHTSAEDRRAGVEEHSKSVFCFMTKTVLLNFST